MLETPGKMVENWGLRRSERLWGQRGRGCRFLLDKESSFSRRKLVCAS